VTGKGVHRPDDVAGADRRPDIGGRKNRLQGAPQAIRVADDDARPAGDHAGERHRPASRSSDLLPHGGREVDPAMACPPGVGRRVEACDDDRLRTQRPHPSLRGHRRTGARDQNEQ